MAAVLKKSVGWKVFMLYGLGNILGAGIYVLIGEVASISGYGIAASFVFAGFIALFTALTYSALASKYPLSAGAAVYTERAFGSKLMSFSIGLALAISGIVSAGVLLNGFANYTQDLINIPKIIPIGIALFALAAIAIKGIKESSGLAVIITLIEVIGLLLIIGFAYINGDFVSAAKTSFESVNISNLFPIFLGAFIAFYAVIGFEDMVNIAEEVIDPKNTMILGIMGALLIATILYVLVSVAAISTVDMSQLQQSSAPLSLVFEKASGTSIPIITIIGLFAVINGVLAQIIMSSRVLYGLAREGWIPSVFSEVSSKYQTPVFGTLVVAFLILVAAMTLPLSALAQITSFIILIIFTVVQIGAIKLVRQKEISLALLIPILGIILNTSAIILQLSSWLGLNLINI